MDFESNEGLFSYFKKTIARDVGKEVAILEHEIAQMKDEALSSYEKDLIDEQKTHLDARAQDISHEYQQKIAAIQRELDLKIMARRRQLLDDLFGQLNKSLQSFCDSKKYQKYIDKKIANFTLNTFSSIVINPNDEYLRSLIPAHLVIKEDASIIGGFILYTKDGRTLFDESLKSQVEKAKKWFYDNADWHAEGDEK